MKKAILSLILSLCLIGMNVNAFAVPQLILGTASVQPGGSAMLPLKLSGGSDNYAGFNAKIVLPSSISVTGISAGDLLSSEFTTDSFLLQNNKLAVIAYSGSTTFSASDGVLLYLNISASNIANLGNYDVLFADTNVNPLVNSRYALSNAEGAISLIPSVVHGKIIVSEQCADLDFDGLCDSWEIEFFGNLSQVGNADYDGDGLTNEEEESIGADPTIKPGENGDINNDNRINLADAIIALQISCGIDIKGISLTADINQDSQIGIQEAIYILQKVAKER